MVGVAVDAVLVVVDEGAGALVVGQLGHPAGQRQRVGGGQRAGVLAARPAGQAGVAVPEQHQPGDAEQLRGPLQLGDAPLGDGLAGPQRHPGAAQLAGGGHDEHGAGAGVGQPAQRDPGEDRLVVRVRVQGEDGVAAKIRSGDHVRSQTVRGR